MSRRLAVSGQATALVLVGLVVLAIPAGFTVVQGISTSAADQQTIPTVTPPSIGSPTPTKKPTGTAPPTPTPTSTPTPDGDNNTDGDDTTGSDGTTGQTYFVDVGVGPPDDVTSDEGCSNANYTMIQAAVNAAEPGDTVAVCPGTYSERVDVTTANLTITVADRVTKAVGDVTITNANESAVWVNAPGVTLQGFNISVSEGADYAIEVGGKESVIRDNTVDSPAVGIFLSDGHVETGECRSYTSGWYNSECDHSPPVDPELGPATGGRVVDNTVTAGHYRIWVDADRAVVQNNVVTDRQTVGQQNQSSSAYCYRNCDHYNSSVVSSGNDTVIRENSVQPTETEMGGFYYYDAGIQIGKTPREGHNRANDNIVSDNAVAKPGGMSIKLRKGAAGTVVQNNIVTEGVLGIVVWDEAVIRNNTVYPGEGHRMVGGSAGILGGAGVQINGQLGFHESGQTVLVINNTVSDYGFGATVYGRSEVKRNTFTNSLAHGVSFSYCNKTGTKRLVDNKIINNGYSGIEGSCRDGFSYDELVTTWEGHIVIGNNQITGNGEHGIFIDDNDNPATYEVHGNLINNNEELGIYNGNLSAIVNATRNIWDCGGPSSGADPLADPFTGRLANGSGDAISGGNGSTRNGHPISNVHFDPFLDLESCPEPQSTPTARPTPTPTPIPTPSPAGGGGGDADGGGGPGSSGSEGDGGTGSANGDGSDSDAPSGDGDGGGAGGETGTPPPTSSATPTATPTATLPPTPSPTPTLSPTPAVEPGFGVMTWFVGVTFLVCLLIVRRRSNPPTVGNHE